MTNFHTLLINVDKVNGNVYFVLWIKELYTTENELCNSTHIIFRNLITPVMTDTGQNQVNLIWSALTLPYPGISDLKKYLFYYLLLKELYNVYFTTAIKTGNQHCYLYVH